MSVRRRERRDLRRKRRAMGREIEQAVVAILATMSGERFDVRAAVGSDSAKVTIEHEDGFVFIGRVRLDRGLLRYDAEMVAVFALSRSRRNYMRSRLAQMMESFDEGV